MLPVACCLLPVACCLLPVACCLLPVACCLLPVACCLYHCLKLLKAILSLGFADFDYNGRDMCSLGIFYHFWYFFARNLGFFQKLKFWKILT
jgi:hypothetical protein